MKIRMSMTSRVWNFSVIWIIHMEFLQLLRIYYDISVWYTLHKKIIILNVQNLHIDAYHGILYEGICFCRNLMWTRIVWKHWAQFFFGRQCIETKICTENKNVFNNNLKRLHKGTFTFYYAKIHLLLMRFMK